MAFDQDWIDDVWSVDWLVRGRLKHGRHFTFKSAQNDVAVTLVPCSVAGAIVTEHAPYAAHGPWLQVGTSVI